MTGREEIDQRNEEWINDKLKNLPSIMTDYMSSVKNKTSWSRRNYPGRFQRRDHGHGQGHREEHRLRGRQGSRPAVCECPCGCA